MKIVTASIGEGDKRAKEIDALKSRYGDSLLVLTEWPSVCPYQFTLGKRSIDLLRFWLLGYIYTANPTVWIDTDTVLLDVPEDEKKRPFFGSIGGTPDIFICGHWGEDTYGPGFFRALLKSDDAKNRKSGAWFIKYLMRRDDVMILPSTSFTHGGKSHG